MNENSKYFPIPQPDELTIREKEDAMGAYLMMFATVAIGIPFPVLNLVAALIYLYINRNKGRFVYFHSLQSLYSQIPVTLLNAGLVVWFLICLIPDVQFTNEFIAYAIMTGIADIIYLIFSLIAAAKARKGIFYYFVFFGKLAYHQAYLNRELTRKKHVNAPPPTM